MPLAHSRLIVLVPLLFVLLWSTGFIGAKYGLPYIEPFNFLFYRMLLNLSVFLLLIKLLNAKTLTGQQKLHQMVVGLLVHAGYLGGVFAAIKLNMPAGLAALLVGLQPLLTALLVWVSGRENLSATQWAGLVLGLSGIVLVLHGNGQLDSLEFSFWAFSLAWLVLGLSVAAVLLLLFMIREGEASRVAAYFYLVPPFTALEAWLLFDERFSFEALVGFAVTVLGVYLVVKQSSGQVTRASTSE